MVLYRSAKYGARRDEVLRTCFLEYNLSTHPYKLYNMSCKKCHLNNNTFTSELVEVAHLTLR